MSSGAWVDGAEAALAAAGHKRGGARRALLELLEAEACALSPLEIERKLSRGGSRSASRASIYRILDQLERLGLLRRVDTGQAITRYERAGSGGEHHHHLVCDACGAVLPFSDAGLERAIKRLTERIGMAVSQHEVVLRGDCGDCADAP